MATITIDGRELQIADDERLNLVQAAERLGIQIPYYCWHPGLSVVASCRMCLVEVGQKTPTGQVQMQPRLVPACQTPARDGTVMVTNSEKVKENRRAVEEYLLLEHPVDCPICDQAGECYLQDYYFQHGRTERRDLPQPFTSRRKDLGPHVTLFTDRCIMCSRCVRFTREISGTAELQVAQRGNHAEIDTFPGFPLENKLSGNVVDICPVGALCSRDFLYQQRVWFLQGQPSVCTGCSAGCNIRIETNRGVIYRLKPRPNPQANGWWLCDEGRLTYKQVAAETRLARPRRRVAGESQDEPWEVLLPALKRELETAALRDGGRSLAVVLSPHLTCEEAYLVAQYAKSLSSHVRLVLGPVPVVGADDAYPKRPDGRPVERPKFVIRAEKCPNRVGVEALLRACQGELLTLDGLLPEIAAGALKSLLVTAGYPSPWVTPELFEALGRLDLLVLADTQQSPLAEAAQYLLPTATWAEKEGSYVNHAGLWQNTERAVRPREEARTIGRIFWELSGRPRLYRAQYIREELVAQVACFAAGSPGQLPEQGVRLGGPQT